MQRNKIILKEGLAVISPIFLICSSDVETLSHKSNNKLSIVEEGETSDPQSHNQLKVPHNDLNLSSATSSAENLASNTRANQHTSYNHSQSSNRLDDIPEDGSATTRRPSILLEMQEMISGRRPSAIMASLRRGSQSILHPFRSKHDDSNDHPHIGAKSPEAVESRRKNRRIGE